MAVAVEIWAVPASGIAAVLLREPPGLSIGKVRLSDGEEVLGVLAEPVLCEGQMEITQHRGDDQWGSVAQPAGLSVVLRPANLPGVAEYETLFLEYTRTPT